MTETLLRVAFEEIEAFGRSAIIKYNGMNGIALELGEGLCGPWKAGDILVYWDDGETTCLPDAFEIVQIDLFKSDLKKES